MVSKSKISSFVSVLLVIAVLCTVVFAVSAEKSVGGSSVVNALLPTSSSETDVSSVSLKAADDWSTNVSSILTANDGVYVVVGNEIKLISSDCKVLKSGVLPGSIGYNCFLTEADGKIIVPLEDASVAAVDSESLETVWKTEAVTTTGEDGKTQYHQIQSATAFDGQNVYIPTVCFNSTYAAVRGEFICVDAESGKVLWSYDNVNGGYYWNTPVIENGIALIASDDGAVTAFSAADGKTLGSLKLSAGSRAGIAKDGENCYAVTKDGTLAKFTVDSKGAIASVGSVKFAYSSTATPVVYDGKVYVGGAFEAAIDWSVPASGVVTVIDAETLTVESSGKTPAEVKSTALLGVRDGVNVYFTCNAYPGALYVLKDGAVSAVFTPDASAQNYCICTPVCDESGHIYYTNDSGNFFSVAAAKIPTSEEGTTAAEETTSEKETTAVPVPTTEPEDKPVPPQVLLGDVDGNGKVNSSDARTVLRITAKLENAPENILTIADMNSDDKINSSDARIILRIAAHLQ